MKLRTGGRARPALFGLVCLGPAPTPTYGVEGHADGAAPTHAPLDCPYNPLLAELLHDAGTQA